MLSSSVVIRILGKVIKYALILIAKILTVRVPTVGDIVAQ